MRDMEEGAGEEDVGEAEEEMGWGWMHRVVRGALSVSGVDGVCFVSWLFGAGGEGGMCGKGWCGRCV